MQTTEASYAFVLEKVEEFLQETYPEINWYDDMSARNKLEELAYIISRRLISFMEAEEVE